MAMLDYQRVGVKPSFVFSGWLAIARAFTEPELMELQSLKDFADFCSHGILGVSKNSGFSPKMDGENNGKPYEQMDDLGGKPTI